MRTSLFKRDTKLIYLHLHTVLYLNSFNGPVISIHFEKDLLIWLNYGRSSWVKQTKVLFTHSKRGWTFAEVNFVYATSTIHKDSNSVTISVNKSTKDTPWNSSSNRDLHFELDSKIATTLCKLLRIAKWQMTGVFSLKVHCLCIWLD